MPYEYELGAQFAPGVQPPGQSDCPAHSTQSWFTQWPEAQLLGFEHGVPFANADTVQWLGSLTSSGGDASAATAPDPLAAVLARARALAADNDLRAAAQCLQDAIGVTDPAWGWRKPSLAYSANDHRSVESVAR